MASLRVNNSLGRCMPPPCPRSEVRLRSRAIHATGRRRCTAIMRAGWVAAPAVMHCMCSLVHRAEVGAATAQFCLRLRGAGAGSLYSILGVHEQASAQEIRSAYRKTALKLHPDKNVDSQAPDTAANFHRLQHAYEVLSDPASRASYDSFSRNPSSHAAWGFEADADAGADDDADTDLDLSRFFGAAAYSGYHEGVGGFFSVYHDVFERIRSIEAESRAQAGVARGGSHTHTPTAAWVDALPSFGNSSSAYHTVVEPFYQAWSEFVSCRRFPLSAVYDVRQATNRLALSIYLSVYL